MPLFTLTQRLERAKSSYDFMDIAYSYAYNGNFEEAAKMCGKAVEASQGFAEDHESAWMMHQNGWPDKHPLLSTVFQQLIERSENTLEQILHPNWVPDYDFLDMMDFLHCARQFHSMGREHAAFNCFSIACKLEQDNTLFDYVEMGHSIRSLNWFEEVNTIQHLIDDIVVSINACLQLPTQELLRVDGEDVFDHYDFAQAGKMALEIGWMQTSASCFKRSIELIEQLDAPTEIQNRELLDVISNFANTPEFGTWALELYESLLEKATTGEKVAQLASYLTIFKNADTEAYLARTLLEKDPHVFDQNEILVPVGLSMQDAELKYHFIAKAIAQTQSAEDLFGIIKSIHGAPEYADLFEQAIEQLDQQPDYLDALFTEYAVEHNLPPEEFMKRLELHVDRYGLDKKVGEELLVRSCYVGRNEVVRKLLELKVDPVSRSDLYGFDTLLASLTDVNIKFQLGGQPIDQDLIFHFIDAGASLLPIRKNRPTSALHEAACDGYLSVVKTLVERGASYELDGDKGKRILLRAAYTARIEVLQYLLDQGCDASTITERPYFWHANSFDDEEKTLELLQAHGAQFS